METSFDTWLTSYEDIETREELEKAEELAQYWADLDIDNYLENE